MAAPKKSVKKTATKKKAVEKLYALSSTQDESLNEPMHSMEEVMTALEYEWDIREDEIITLYELVPIKKFKSGQKFVEVK